MSSNNLLYLKTIPVCLQPDINQRFQADVLSCKRRHDTALSHFWNNHVASHRHVCRADKTQSDTRHPSDHNKIYPSAVFILCFTWAQCKAITSCGSVDVCSTKKDLNIVWGVFFLLNSTFPLNLLWLIYECCTARFLGQCWGHVCLLFLLYQGPQRRGKERGNTSGDSDSSTQQTSHDSFDEGDTSPESQRGSSSKCRIQAPAVSSHTWIIWRLRKSNPLCTHWKV